MITPHLSAFVNHLWQSTLWTAAVWLIARILQENRASLRYWLWFTASVKFLIPFSLLVTVGSQVAPTTHIWPNPAPLMFDRITQPLSPSSAALATSVHPSTNSFDGTQILFAVWLFGFALSLLTCIREWLQLRSILRAAKPLPLALPVHVHSSPARIEPGVFGIFKPVLLLPEGIVDRLTPPQLRTIVAHELCHIRRHDNLTAVIHMLVESIFWFYPVLGWIRLHLIEERERACDEEVLSAENNPQTYAEAILKVCKIYLHSPSICASAVTGADLKKRIMNILADAVVRDLSWGRKLLLAACGTFAIGSPFIFGILTAAPSQAQPPVAFAGAPEFAVASIKPNRTGAPNSGFRRFRGGQLDATNITLKMLIAFAYDIPKNEVFGGPAWLDSEKYDILAKPDAGANSPGDQSMSVVRLRTQALLADRFKLTLRKESRLMPVFQLVVAGDGPKNLHPAKDSAPDLITNNHHVACQSSSMEFFAKVFLTPQLGRPVIDKTGINGAFDFAMDWTPDEIPKSPADSSDTTAAQEFSGPTFFTALRQELGLKLEAAKGPVPVLVVDHAEKASEN